MSIGIGAPEAKVFNAKICEHGHFFDSHVMINASDWPIEKDATDLTDGARNEPCNSAGFHVVSALMVPDCMVTALFEIIARLIPVACHDINLISKSQRDEVSAGVAAVASSLVGMIVVNMDAHDAPVFLAATDQPTASKVFGHFKFCLLIVGSGA